MDVAYRIEASKQKKKEICQEIKGYWSNDKWDIRDSQFDGLRPKKWGSKKVIDFSHFNEDIKNEIKFFFMKGITKRDYALHTAVHYAVPFSYLKKFLSKRYPNIKSIIELNSEKHLIEWRTYLIGQGLKPAAKSWDYDLLLKKLVNFYRIFYDTRDVYERDVWDCREIGVKVTISNPNYRIRFNGIPEKFRHLVKKYLKVKSINVSQSQCSQIIRALELFLTFIHKKYPIWINLNELSRTNIEEYLNWYNRHTQGWVECHITYLNLTRAFLEYTQLAEYEEAPETPVYKLLFKEDIPKGRKYNPNTIKHIPEEVLQQLEENIEYIRPPECISLVIILRATGWRSIDVLNLKYDKCLQKTSQGWYICGDITKTDVLDHRVPITDDVAAVVMAQIEETKSKSTEKSNPNKYLFVNLTGKRKGQPPTRNAISAALNRLAKEKNIVDSNGKVFHFLNHAFRHTKGIELINNGMNILHVQKWMAHASPEMTLRYAKILDTTMRKSWEEIVGKGIFKVNDRNGKIEKVEISNVENEDLIEWEYIRHNLDAVRIPLGFCLKPSKIECNHQLNPCLTCNNMCTSPEFLNEFEEEIKETKRQIERAFLMGRTMWVEKNKIVLERLKDVVKVLQAGQVYHKAGKRRREYVGEERENGTSQKS